MKNLSIDKMENNGGTKHTGVPVKTLKKLLKKAGLKVSGKKATLTRRAKKARLLKGGLFGMFKSKSEPITPVEVPRKMSDTEQAFYDSPDQVAYRADYEKRQREREEALRKANNQNTRAKVERKAAERGDTFYQPYGGSGKKKTRRS